MLLDPDQGPAISSVINGDLIRDALAPTFAPGYDLSADATDMWASMARADGQRNAHLARSAFQGGAHLPPW